MSNFVRKKEYLRGILLHCFIKGKSAAEAHRILVKTYGDQALSKTTCRDWFRRFKNNDFKVGDKERSGAPKKFEDEQLEALLRENSCQTLAELAESLGVDHTTVSKRLKALRMIQKAGHWVRHELKPRDVERPLLACEQSPEREKRKDFLQCIVTGDEKWIHYDKREHRKLWELPAKTRVLKSIALLLKNCPPPRVRKPPPLVRKRPKKILAIDGVSRIPEFNTACVESSLFAVPRLDREQRLLPLHDGCVHAECEEVDDAPRLSSRSRLDGAWLESILSSDEALAAACGIRSHSVLDEIVVDLLQHYPEQLSDPRESIILTTMKLRTDLSFAALAELFGYGAAHACRRIFVRTLRGLAIALRPALRWSPGQREDAPKPFRGFESTAIALSHVWLALRRPKCPDCRAKTWCPAKRRFVAKFIAGVTPKGTFVYASELLAAETSDSVVFERSDLVQRVDHGCAIMFNVGFSGIDGICKKYGMRIYAHLNSGDKKLSTQEVSFNRRIADARAHVNRTIRRIRRFAILKSTIPWTLVPQLQDAVVVCCALANLERSNQATNIKKPS